ncbi:MAG: UDP-N-acetylmuramate:L-alanyl-gamma-D-glutamyl-meso-diaminopimelate ligase [Arenicella sp.]
MTSKKIHIIGICGTFMGGVAKLAKELGFQVQGSDQNTYPPMSTQLESLGVTLFNGYDSSNIDENIDTIIVGNTISRGNPELEYVLNTKMPYISGAQWLSENVLHERWVLAISGTHGKTTTSSLLAWILEDCGYQPGFLIGGVPENFGISARLGKSDFFVIEADEYDTAFSDKRSKFIHYKPNTLVINNLEFDHADIFSDLKAIQTQFHHLIKIIPTNGQIIYNAQQSSIQETLEKGIWSETQSFSYSEKNNDEQNNFHVIKSNESGSAFDVIHENKRYSCEWNLIGEHNLNNAIAAIAAARHIGVTIQEACQSLKQFKSVKRRLELRGQVNNICVYDDFAHHPTAIASTISGLKARINSENHCADNKQGKLIAVIEARSNTMKMGTHKHALKKAVIDADRTFFAIPENVSWDTDEISGSNIHLINDIEQLVSEIISIAQPNDHILIMSNGGFSDIHNILLGRLA